MRYGELKDAVNALGGQDVSLVDQYDKLEQVGDERFCSIVTRAMSEINLLRPRVSETTLLLRAPRSSFCFSKPVFVNGYIEIPVTGAKAYTLEYKGVGTITIGEGVSESINSPYAFARKSGVFKTAAVVAIRIEATHMLTVRNVAVYTEVMSDRVDDVPPYSDRIEYTVSEADFVALSPKSISLDDEKEYGIKIRDNRYISVPWSAEGELTVRYDRKIKAVTVNTTDSEELDLDEDLARALLPSLVASYVFYSSTDSVMSVYLRQIYESDRALIVSKIRNADASRVYSTNNW